MYLWMEWGGTPGRCGAVPQTVSVINVLLPDVSKRATQDPLVPVP